MSRFLAVLLAAFVWLFYVGAATAGIGGNAIFTDPHAWASLNLSQATAGRKLNLALYQLVYTDNFAGGPNGGSTQVACDIGTENNSNTSGNHNWYAVVEVQGTSDVHQVGPSGSPNPFSCPIAGMSQGVTMHMYWNPNTSQYEGGDLESMSRGGYGVNYTYALFHVRARWHVPQAGLYPWGGLWSISDDVDIGYPARNDGWRVEWDGLETYPPNTAIATYTYSGGSGGTPGVYSHVPFNGTHGNSTPVYTLAYGPAYFTVTVNAAGAISSMVLEDGGGAWKAGDTLTPSSAPFGVPTNAQVTVSTLAIPSNPQGTIDTTLIQHTVTSSAVCAGHVSAAGSGGTPGVYPKVFSGGHGYSFNGTITVGAGGGVSSIIPVLHYSGFNYQAGDSLTATGTGLPTGFTYAVDGICNPGPASLPSADRQMSTFISPEPQIANWPFTGNWYDFYYEYTPNAFIAYVDLGDGRGPLEYARIPVSGQDMQRPQIFNIQNVALDATPLGTSGINTAGGDYQLDISQFDVYQCIVGASIEGCAQ